MLPPSRPRLAAPPRPGPAPGHPPASRWRALGLGALVAASALAGPAEAARPVAGALAPDRLKLPSGPNSVRGLTDEPEVDPFYAKVGYSVPIDVPAGWGGLAPSLAFTYSGALGNGPLGIGWDMPGARIERSTRQGLPTFTSTDELELFGPVSGRLVAIGAGEYRVEGMGQTVRVRAVGQGFEVDAGDGRRLRFGVGANARQEATVNGATRTAAWMVEEETNLAGERVAYEYIRDQNQLYLTRASWGPGAVYSAELSYVVRPDPTTSYREGFRVVTARRLDRVRVVAFGVERRAYQLGYDDSFPVSRLAQVSSTGRAGSGAWPTSTFEYAAATTPQVTPMPGVGTWRLNAAGATLVDLDADGAADLLQAAEGGHSYRLNQNGTFGAAQPLTGNTSSITALQLQDVDGDARAELLLDTGSGWSVWKWSKTKWIAQVLPGGVWPGSAGLALKNPTSTRFADLNGDGLVDAIKWQNDGLSIYQATRTGILAPRSAPRIGGVALPTAAGRFQDTNGDGLDDYVVVIADRLELYLGHGDGTFEPATTRAYPFTGAVASPDDLHLVDLDRDDLLDLVRVDLGTVRWFRGRADGSFSTTPVTVTNPEPLSADVVVTIGDVNGNGSQDVVWSSATNMWRLDLVGATTAGMLTRTRNGLGLDVTLSYRSAHAISVDARLAQDPWQYELPVAMPVPVRKTTALGPGETTRQIDYLVRDGYWDAAERSFAGFLGTIVTTWGATPAQTSSVQTKYHAGAGASRALRGKPLVEQVRNGSGQRLSITTNTWEAMLVSGLPDTPLLRKAALRESRVRQEEGSVLETRTTHDYDALGRPIRTTRYGRVDLLDDDVIEEQTYADDATTWVRDQVCERKTSSAAGAVVRREQILFGDDLALHPLCVVGKGWRRRTSAWLAEEGRFVVREDTSYDAHGNPLQVQKGGVTRSYVYDANALFPLEERVHTAASQYQTWTTTWDYVLGAAQSLTDPNGHTTQVGYDALGRMVFVALDARPPHQHVQYDWTAPYPKTTVWEYDGDAASLGALPPTWTAGSGWRQATEVTNGLGEVRYRATRSAASQWIVSDYTERDPASRQVFRGRPTYVGQLELAARPAGMVGDQIFYDPLGRVIEQRLATGAARTFRYASFERTQQEATLAPVRNVFDGQGRIITTQRTATGGAKESIAAAYDAAGQITSMSLSGGVTRTFRYDTLGRLLESQDPDLGVRTFTWDDGDRLLAEQNAAGQSVLYAYDAAGRLIERNPGAPFRYHYDAARPGAGAGPTSLIGRLAWVEEPTGALDLGYDALGRTVFARRIVDGHAAEERTDYTASGLVRRRGYDDGLELDYQYDAAGRVTAIGDVWTATELDAAGRPLTESFRNGVTASYQRDAIGLPSAIEVRDASGAALYSVQLGRNAWSGIESVTDVDGAGLDHSATFVYDDFARLTGADLGVGKGRGAFAYGYDGLHNMVSRAAPASLGAFTGTYHYGESGAGPRQLTSITDAGGLASHSMTYDAAGRQIGQDGLTLTYDASDRLLSVQGLPGGAQLAHAYGHDGLRVKTVDGQARAAYFFSESTAERLGQREHEIELAGRVLARVTLSPTGGANAPALGVLEVRAGLWGLALLAAAAAAARGGRRSRWLRAGAAGLAGLTLAASCTQSAPQGRLASASWGAARWVFCHAGIGPGPVLYTDEAGALLEERRYEPFGEEIDALVADDQGNYAIGAPALEARDRNALNKRTELATGWSDHGARWLAPETGRWLTPDPPVQGPSPEQMFAPWDLHPYQYVAQNPITYWDPDGREKRTTFTDAEINRMFWFFVDNAAKPRNPRGSEGNTDPAYRYSCIGTANHAVDTLLGERVWPRGSGRNGPATIDRSQNHVVALGRSLGEATVRYGWDVQNAWPKARASEWDTVISLANGDKGWSVYLVSIAGGFHSATVTLDNRDPANPIIAISDQNESTAGWKEFSTKAEFDQFMLYKQANAGAAYADPDRKPHPLIPPPVKTRYVRLAPE